MLWLPRAFPDELLISRLIRFVTIAGWSGLSEIYNLMGSKKRCIHPTLTASLCKLASQNIDEANCLLMHQTLAPLYMYYLPRHASEIKNALFSDNSSKALRECQFPSFGTESSLILKSCPQCAEKDIAAYGVSYWHRMHQIPGISVCASHQVSLNVDSLNQRQRLISGFLPSPVRPCTLGDEDSFQFAQFTNAILQKLSNSQINISAVIQYRNKLRQDGFVTQQGRVRHHKLMSAFFNDISDSSLPSNQFLPSDENDYGYLYHLLNMEFSVHPGRHLIFAFWLFRSIENIMNCIQYSFNDQYEVHDIKEPVFQPSIDIIPVLSKDISMNQMSVILGKSRCFIKRIAALQGIKLKCYPKKLTEELRHNIESLGYLGFHRKAIAERCQIGVGSVESVISSCKGLVARRKLCHYQSSLRRNKFKIVHCRKINPDITRNEIRKIYNAQFFWLYHHERSLLESILPPAMPAKGAKLRS
ncbi:TnsD family Tn7-like transposition protein [Leclercia sp. AS011]|uniref:TnsD family Tn7-like transposition protein n=1 Tax=Leclercia sp. AS011 TaxID=3081257 RepID=UPI00301B0F63